MRKKNVDKELFIDASQLEKLLNILFFPADGKETSSEQAEETHCQE